MFQKVSTEHAQPRGQVTRIGISDLLGVIHTLTTSFSQERLCNHSQTEIIEPVVTFTLKQA